MSRKLGIWYPKAALDVRNVVDPFKGVIFNQQFMFPKTEGNFNPTASYNFSSTLDGNPVVKTFNDFIIPTGVTVSTSNRCKGLYLKILGNLIINGTLSMTARGASAAGKHVAVFDDRVLFCNALNDTDKVKDLRRTLIYPTGGLGKTTGSNPGVNGACGSGGCGMPTSIAKRGGNGTSFSGGAGAGSSYTRLNVTSTAKTITAGSDNGGKGGNSTSYSNVVGGLGGSSTYSGGAGSGNPGGTCYDRETTTTVPGGAGKSGTGGLIILLVEGNVTINGSLQANGVQGGTGGRWDISGAYGYGGGGSGGGAIHIFHKGEIVGANKISVAGGAGGLHYELTTLKEANGCAGGKGTINIKKIE